MNGLEVVELEPETFWGKLLKGRNVENAYREVNNLIASSPIFQIYHDGVLAVIRQYGLTFEVARPRLIEIYRKVVRHFAKDGELKGLDAEHVERLGELCGLSLELMAEINAEELARLKSGSAAS
jgi:hypothetical protein